LTSKRPRRTKVPKKIAEVVKFLIASNVTEDSSVQDEPVCESTGKILVDLFNLAKNAEKQFQKFNAIEI